MHWNPPAPIRARRWNSGRSRSGVSSSATARGVVHDPPAGPQPGQQRDDEVVQDGVRRDAVEQLPADGVDRRRSPRAALRAGPRTSSGTSRTSSTACRRSVPVSGSVRTSLPHTAPTAGSAEPPGQVADRVRVGEVGVGVRQHDHLPVEFAGRRRSGRSPSLGGPGTRAAARRGRRTGGRSRSSRRCSRPTRSPPRASRSGSPACQGVDDPGPDVPLLVVRGHQERHRRQVARRPRRRDRLAAEHPRQHPDEYRVADVGVTPARPGRHKRTARARMRT